VQRYVLRYRGKGKYPAAVLEALRASGASIIEDTERMLLVEAPEHGLDRVLGQEWLVTPEVSYALPDPRRSIK